MSIRRLGGLSATRCDSKLEPADIPRLTRLSFWLLCSKFARIRKAQRKFSELFDANEAPFFRSFLKVEVDPGERTVTIRCYGATGRVRHEHAPPEEDWITLSFAGRVVAEMPR